MATRRASAMGMGLDALLGPRGAVAPAGQPAALKLSQLQPGHYQPRTRMDEGSLYELAESIKGQGVMQPILVRPLDDARYEIIAGERRFRAAKLAGLGEVPVLVRHVPDEAAAVMALIENIQREDLNPIEEAQGLKRLIDEFGLTHERAAQAVGRSRSAASNLLRLLNLTPPVQQMLLAGDIEMGHARALLALDATQQILTAAEVGARKLSVRETEGLVARSRRTGLAPAAAAAKPPEVVRLEAALAARLGARVEIRVRRGNRDCRRVELAIRFASRSDLHALLERVHAMPIAPAQAGKPVRGQGR